MVHFYFFNPKNTYANNSARTQIGILFCSETLFRKQENENNNNTKVIGYRSSNMSFTNRLKRVNVNIYLMVEKVLELNT